MGLRHLGANFLHVRTTKLIEYIYYYDLKWCQTFLIYDDSASVSICLSISGIQLFKEEKILHLKVLTFLKLAFNNLKCT